MYLIFSQMQVRKNPKKSITFIYISISYEISQTFLPHIHQTFQTFLTPMYEIPYEKLMLKRNSDFDMENKIIID